MRAHSNWNIELTSRAAPSSARETCSGIPFEWSPDVMKQIQQLTWNMTARMSRPRRPASPFGGRSMPRRLFVPAATPAMTDQPCITNANAMPNPEADHCEEPFFPPACPTRPREMAMTTKMAITMKKTLKPEKNNALRFW
eukprot:4958228-Prymnesium_polylepis.1